MIDIKIDTVKIHPDRKLKVKWVPEKAQDLGAFHGIYTNHISAEFRQTPKKGDLMRYTNIIDPRHRQEGESRVGLCLTPYDPKEESSGEMMIDNEVWTFSPNPHTGIDWIEVIDE